MCISMRLVLVARWFWWRVLRVRALSSLRSVSLGCLPMTAQKQCVMVGSELHMYLQGNSREVYQYVFGFGGAFGRLWRQRWRRRDGDGDGSADSQIVRFSNSQIVQFSDCPFLKFSDCPILKFSDCQILRFSNSQILRFSNS